MARIWVILSFLLVNIIGLCAAEVDREGAFIGYSERTVKVCVDKDGEDKCKGWAASGECEKNPGFMRLKCARSCDSCNDNDLATNPKLPPLPSNYSRSVVVFSTSRGDIRILLRPDIAPRTAAYVLDVVTQGGCDSCHFYRSEKLPEPGAIDNYGGPGPPYALLQGSLGTPLFKAIQKEGAPAAGRGFACMIGTGPDFFLAVGPHTEWGTAHTVWGEVEPASMQIVDGIVNELPIKKETWGETHVTVLVSPLPFTLTLAAPPRE